MPFGSNSSLMRRQMGYRSPSCCLRYELRLSPTACSPEITPRYSMTFSKIRSAMRCILRTSSGSCGSRNGLKCKCPCAACAKSVPVTRSAFKTFCISTKNSGNRSGGIEMSSTNGSGRDEPRSRYNLGITRRLSRQMKSRSASSTIIRVC